MNAVSAILRFLCGLTLIVAAYATHRRASGHIAAGEPIEIAGITIGASPSELSFALAAVALIGVVLIVLGVVTLVKKRE